MRKIKSLKQKNAERKAQNIDRKKEKEGKKLKSGKKPGPKLEGYLYKGGKRKPDILIDTDGVPLADPPINRRLLADLTIPDTGGHTHLEKEKAISQCEILMLKGVVSPSHISATVGIDYSTAKKYMESVSYRWAVLGGTSKMRILKGEAKARLDLINNEAWVLYSNTENHAVKSHILGQLLSVHDKKLILEGLTPITLPLIAASEAKENLSESVEDKMQKHSNLVRLAGALTSYMDKGKKDIIVEGDFTEVSTE